MLISKVQVQTHDVVHTGQACLNVDWTEDSPSVAACIITVKVNIKHMTERYHF